MPQGDENKAEAMYRLASCLFESDDLTFYNPAAWGGGRGLALSDLLFSDHERLPNETRIIFEHLQAHDPWARAIPIYLQIVDRYPQTKIAKDALYTVAVAHQRLSERNGPWGVFYDRGMFAGPRMVTYADVKNIYPSYQLPRGTYGWQPLTRTVNDGPGWAPPPKPLPKLTREQKIRRIISRVYSEFQPKIEQKWHSVVNLYDAQLQFWFNVVLAVIGFLLCCYVLLLCVHFRKPSWILNRSNTLQLFAADSTLEKLPTSESRMEKVIDSN